MYNVCIPYVNKVCLYVQKKLFNIAPPQKVSISKSRTDLNQLSDTFYVLLQVECFESLKVSW